MYIEFKLELAGLEQICLNYLKKTENKSIHKSPAFPPSGFASFPLDKNVGSVYDSFLFVNCL